MNNFILLIFICLIGLISIFLVIVKTIINQVNNGKIKFDIGKIEVEEDFESTKIESTADYIDFEKITSRYKEGFSTKDKSGVMVLDDGTRFIAGILVKGHNFALKAKGDVASCIISANNFVEKMEGYTTFRQSTKKPDSKKQIEDYEKIIDRNILMMAELALDREDLVSKLEIYIDSIDEQSDLELLTNEIDRYEKEIKNLEVKNLELKLMAKYIEINSDFGALDDVQTYFFEWQKSAIENSTLKTEDQILKYAFKEIDLIGEKYMNAINATGARSRRLTSEEILDAFRVVTKPYSAQTVPIESEIRNFSSIFKFSDNLSDIRKQMEEEEKINELLKEMEIQEA